MIRLTRPSLDDEDARAVTDVLLSGMLVQGERVAAFERVVADVCRRAEAVAVSSGTAALALALEALGLGPGDEVLVPALTWPSPAHAVMLVGATPVLVDVDPREWNAGAAHFTAARGPRTRAAIVIDQFGYPARHGEIAAALEDLLVVEDAACALGSVLDGQPCGSFGDVACLSFHPRKIVTTGEGGICLTDDAALADRLRVLRNHGQAGPGRFSCAAGNHRLTELGAALGIVQMGKLDAIVRARRTWAARYQSALLELGCAVQVAASGAVPNHQTLGVLAPPGVDRDHLVERLRNRGVEAGLLSYGLHRVDSLADAADAARAAGRTFDATDDITGRGFALPLFPQLTDAEFAEVIAALTTCLAEAR